MNIRPHFKYNPSHQWFSIYFKVFPIQAVVGIVIFKCDFWVYFKRTDPNRPWWTPRTYQWPHYHAD